MLSPPLTLAVVLLGISMHSEIKYVKLTFPCDITNDVEKQYNDSDLLNGYYSLYKGVNI